MKNIEHVVVRFSGDSGDGMQITGTQFSSTAAQMGNDLATFPDFPAEIRAPQGTVAGISGFQVHIGAIEINTPGDRPDVLVAMNPAALKANLEDIPKGATIILNSDSFNEMGFKKAGYASDPRLDLKDYNVIEAQITSQTKEALKDLELDSKSKSRCKNFYALGMTYFMFSRDLEPTLHWIKDKFIGNELLQKANTMALKAGHNYAETIDASASHVYKVAPATISKGTYRQISGNVALSWGFIYAAQNAGLDLFLGSYPITPASDILHELSKHKRFGVKTFQAEDEIAACCSAIGASYAGALAITTSSGPGIALKSEALNLAIMLELPLVMIDVQRGGPSTGLPTKTEQSDLNMAMYGRNGESPAIVLAAKSPSDCFHMAFEAARLTIEHMTPVILLSDGYIANGATPWKIPDLGKEYPQIKTHLVGDEDLNDGEYLPYKRDAKSLVRKWALPGMEGFTHRLGGLEKEHETGNVSYDAANHELMVNLRAKKVMKVADNIPNQKVEGNKDADLLVVSWGGTYGSVHQAVKEVNTSLSCAHIHMQYLNPMPKNIEKILRSYKKVFVCELNQGQLKAIINSKYSLNAKGYGKVQGKPFMVRELVQVITKEIKSN